MYVLANQAKKNFVRENIYYILIYIEVFCILIYQIYIYAPSDGLHLNFTGTDLLRKKIINIIKHLSSTAAKNHAK